MKTKYYTIKKDKEHKFEYMEGKEKKVFVCDSNTLIKVIAKDPYYVAKKILGEDVIDKEYDEIDESQFPNRVIEMEEINVAGN